MYGLVTFLLDIFIQFGTKLYRQVVGISPREGGTLIFLYIPRLGSFLGVKILNFNIYGVFRKINIFGGYEDFVDIFWGRHKIELYLGVISIHFRVFFLSHCTE